MDFTLVGEFPSGTTVGVYPYKEPTPQGAPGAATITTAVAGASSVTFTDLDADTRYLAGAEITGTWRYLEFRTDPAPAESGSAFAHLTEDTENLALHGDYPLVLASDADYDSFWVGAGDSVGRVTSLAIGDLLFQQADASDTDPIFSSKISDGFSRFVLDADGSLHWGDGTAAPDTALRRSGYSGALWLDTNAGAYQILVASDEDTTTPGSPFVAIADTVIYGGAGGDGSGEWGIDRYGVVTLKERAAGDAAAPQANRLSFYAKDVGGKTALMARFNTGSPVQIAIEP